MRPAEVLSRATDYLERHSVESPRPTAELLLASVLGTDRAALYTRTEGLSSAEARRFGRALCRRCTGTPAQHLTGLQGFRHLTLAVRPGVFIPRPETEIVAGIALATIDGRPSPVVVDVGTGAGPIALAIAAERPDARVIATDVSSDALELAAENAERLGLVVDFRLGDLLEQVDGDEPDLIVSNPPYVRAHELEDLPPVVRADPQTALIEPPGIYGRLFRQSAHLLRPGGAVVVEIEETRGAEIAREAVVAGLTDVVTHPDLAGRDRVVSAVKP